jgi:hypothetical protein
MPLRLFEPTLGEVPAKLRHLYRLDAEQGYALDCDLDKHVHGLKAALATERAEVKRQRLLIADLRQRTEVISIGGD